MSKNINQVFIANPITSNAGTDLMYFGQSPYGAGNDAAMTFSNFSAQFVLSGAIINPAHGGTGVNNGTSTITIGGNVSFSGAFTFTGTLTANTAVTFPTSGTLLNNTLTSANFYVGNAGNVATGVAMSGDAALANTGAITVSKINGVAISLAGSFTTSGAFAVTQTYTGVTTVTFPTSGTLATTSQLPTPAALTQVSDTNVTLTLGGTPATALLQAVSITAGWAGTLAGSRGGLGAAITANNGGIYYSTASNGALLAGTVTANQMLQSGATAAPSWSTSTWPATTTINQILYSSAANIVGGITTANGGVLITNNTGVPSILAGSGTTGTILQAVSSSSPAWSTATYPSTTTINQILYSSSANVVAGISTANSATLITSSTGVPSFTASMTNGQVLIGSTGASPNPGTISAGTGITVTNGAGTISISVNGADQWVDQISASVTMATNTGYTSDDGASLVTFTLPTTSAIGDWIEINGKGSGLWKIAQATGQQIHIGTSTTTSGATGSLASVNQYDCVRLRCITANTIWNVTSQQSSGLTVV